MILRAMGLGFLLWLATAAAFRFGGQFFFVPDETPRLIAFIAAPIVAIVLTFTLLKLLREASGDEGEAAVGLAFPGMLLDVFISHEFPRVFPNIDPTLDGAFAALALLFYAAVLFTGLMMTRLSPQDERI
jgi:Family of unknown function (DUF5367)